MEDGIFSVRDALWMSNICSRESFASSAGIPPEIFVINLLLYTEIIHYLSQNLQILQHQIKFIYTKVWYFCKQCCNVTHKNKTIFAYLGNCFCPGSTIQACSNSQFHFEFFHWNDCWTISGFQGVYISICLLEFALDIDTNKD